jgi:YHS domain-containing protein
MDDVDPVCGMEVESDSAAARSEFEGDVYSFCSLECREQFERAPERFVTTRLLR